MIERKNVLRLADAFESIRHDGETLTFVGSDDDQLANEIRARSKYVRIVDAVEPDRVAAFISSAHVVCQPSLIEPFGLGALEGLARGRTVLGTRIGGHTEFVPPTAGVLVNPRDERELAHALRKAADSYPRPNVEARRAAERHALTKTATSIEAILERAIRDHRRMHQTGDV